MDSSKFENIDTTPVLCRTGKPDQDWEALRRDNPGIWSDEGLKRAAQEFAKLDQSQHAAIKDMYSQNNKTLLIYSDKSLRDSAINKCSILGVGML